MKLSDPVLIAMITTIPTIGVTVTGFLVAWRGYRKDQAEERRFAAQQRMQTNLKMDAIHETVNGKNDALTSALAMANEKLARVGLPIVTVLPVEKKDAA